MKKILFLLVGLSISMFAHSKMVILTMSDYEATSFSDKNLSITTSKGTGYTNPAYNSTSADLRIYANGTITISSIDTAHITSIVFDLSYQGQQQLAKLTSTNGTVSQASDPAEASWSGFANSVTFTVGAKRCLELSQVMLGSCVFSRFVLQQRLKALTRTTAHLI